MYEIAGLTCAPEVDAAKKITARRATAIAIALPSFLMTERKTNVPINSTSILAEIDIIYYILYICLLKKIEINNILKNPTIYNEIY
jgi:hypothetical protein